MKDTNKLDTLQYPGGINPVVYVQQRRFPAPTHQGSAFA
jgi:hypothetical protein